MIPLELLIFVVCAILLLRPAKSVNQRLQDQYDDGLNHEYIYEEDEDDGQHTERNTTRYIPRYDAELLHWYPAITDPDYPYCPPPGAAPEYWLSIE